jgi:mono/diheme cytochrome c family protein
MKRAAAAITVLALSSSVLVSAADRPDLEPIAPRGGTPGELEALLDDDLGAGADGAIPAVLLEALVELPGERPSVAELYERYGFLFVRGRDLPVGITERRILGVRLRAYNCLLCHTGAEEGALVVGATNRNLDFSGFLAHVLGTTRDLVTREGAPRALERLVAAARRHRAREGERLGPAEAAALVAYAELIARAGPHVSSPAYGPGRTVVAGAYRVLRFHMTPGPYAPVKPPDLFGVTARSGLLWTGNERYAADVPAEEKIARNGLLVPWVQLSPLTGRPAPDQAIVERLGRHRKMAALLVRAAPPPAPAPPADRRERHAKGRALYLESCSRCHGEYAQKESGGRLATEVASYRECLVPVADAGTDPAYEASQDMAFARRVADTPIGALYARIAPEGTYVARPLLGLRLRFPYLHNGSVPSLRALLLAPDERPRSFLAGADAPLDADAVGYGEGPANGPRVERRDTTLPGNRATGHDFGTALSPDEKRALIEYLRTL